MDSQLIKEIEKLNIYIARKANSNEIRIKDSKAFDRIFGSLIQDCKNEQDKKGDKNV